MEMIMAVLVFCVFLLSLFCFFPHGENLSRDFFLPQKIPRKDREIFAENKKPTRLRVGWNFFFTALTTNSPLASYLGGTQNRNQYE
jgi:hypothetical protein